MSAISTEKKISKEKQLELTETLGAFQAKERLGFILSRVREDAQQFLLQSDSFQNLFLETRQCQAFVMAVDIRRSTELMLKARTPEEFSLFITTLCEDLKEIILDGYGVFDKFTGDGVLAFFPDFYSGDDAAYRIVSVADKCHASFERHYHAFRKSFNSVLTDVGLGIGIDFGLVHLVNIAGGLTVVGVPVVYACRLSGAPSGNTFLKQPAYEQVMEKSGQFCFIDETNLEIKHEGKMLAYDVRLNARSFAPEEPSWLREQNGKHEMK